MNELWVVREAVEPPAFFFIFEALNEGRSAQEVEKKLLPARRENADEAGFYDVVGEVCGGGRCHGDE